MLSTALTDLHSRTVSWDDRLSPQLRRDWENLITACPHTPVFSYPDWLEMAVNAQVIKPCCLLTIYLGKHPIGIIPLHKRTYWTAEVCYPLSEDFPAMVIDPQAEELAWYGFMLWCKAYSRFGLLSLGRWRNCLQIEMVQQTAFETGLFPFTRRIEPDIWISFPESWAEYLASLNTDIRRNLQRREKQFRQDFGEGFAVDILTGNQITRERVDELITLHRQRWHGQRGSYFDHERNTDFYREITCWAAGKGYLVMPVLRLNGKTITLATIFHLPGQQIAYAHCMARDVEALPNNYSPGIVLFTHFFRWAIARGIKHVSMGIGTSYYKRLFGGREYQRSELFIARSRREARVLMKIDPAVYILQHLPVEMQMRFREYRDNAHHQ